MELGNLKPSDMISLGSALAAIASASYAYKSASVAKKALMIAEQEFNSKKENIDLYLIDAYKLPYNIDENRFYAFVFNLTITNRSALANTVSRVELEMKFIRNNDTSGSSVYASRESVNCDAVRLPEPLAIPLSLEPKSAKTGWLIFQVPKDNFKGRRIESYIVKTFDVHSKITSVEACIIKEAANV